MEVKHVCNVEVSIDGSILCDCIYLIGLMHLCLMF